MRLPLNPNSSLVAAHFTITKATYNVIIHHAYRLHECITDGRSYEAESPLDQVLAHRIRLICAGRNPAHGFPSVDYGLPAYKLPDIPVEADELFPHRKQRLRILYCRFDFKPVPYDFGIAQQLAEFSAIVPYDNLRVEAIERNAITATLLEDRLPVQSRLCSLEYQELEEFSVAMQRDAPLPVVVPDQPFVARPSAPDLAADFCGLRFSHASTRAISGLTGSWVNACSADSRALAPKEEP